MKIELDKELFDRGLINTAFYFKWWIKILILPGRSVYPSPNLYLPNTLITVEEEKGRTSIICRYKLKCYG